MKQEQGKNTFIGSRMDKDTDSRLLEPGVYRDALNVRVGNSSGSDVGALENSLSNKKLTNKSFGANATCIGMYSDKNEQKVYWFVVSDDGSYVMEYDFPNGVTSVVLEDTSAGVLNFNKEYLITGVNIIIDTDKKRRLLYWTDNLNPPRSINIDRAKTYGANNFTEEQISVIKAPPLQKPSIALGQTNTGLENNIEEKFLRFAYRYRYLDGEYSALSSFSETAFLAKPFNFDYAVSSNEGMVNNFSKVSIAFNTGSKLVTEIDVVFKESGTNTVYLVDSYKKESKNWGDNENQFVEFFNNKIKKALDQDQLFRLYDAVPLKAKAQELIGNRLVYGFYTENYNIEDANGSAIDVDFSLEGINTAINIGTPTESLKSNRDYEIGIVYLDKYGRQTSVLTSENNTINFPNIDSLTQNQIKAVVNSPAPNFAEKFRFYIKQTREDYDIIVPTIFYLDGPYVWVKLEGSEDNKIEEGDYLYVKADTQEVLPQLVQTKVLEIKNQPKDFLEDSNKQLSGNYMRLKPNNYRLDPDDYEFYDWDSYDSSKNANDNPIRGNQSYVEPAVYYGTSLSDDLTSSGTYTGLVDERYEIEIIVTGATDEFRWTKDEGQNWSANTPITGAAQAIENGVEITFASVTGHSLDDSWVVGAKSSSDDSFGGSESSKAYGFFKGPDTNNGVIYGGARIEWEYSEYGEETQKITRNFVSTRKYENIEEWYYGDNIYDEISEIGESRIWFRRGLVEFNYPGNQYNNSKHITVDPAEDMVMIVKSKGTQNSDLDGVVKLRTSLEIFQAEQNVIFETIPFSNDAAPFFEIGQTYDIVNGFHTSSNASDVDQALGVAGEFVLDVFNCIAWGNAFESYKIKDLFNAKTMKIDTRPSDSIEDYSENIRIASLTYSKVYEQTLNYNGTNEFNLSTINFVDIDDKYNSIQKLFSRDTDLIVFQEDKLHKMPFEKDVLFTAAGEGAVTESNKVFGKEIPYAGEFGISLNPESFAFYGNNIYFTDQRRGSVMRLNLNGLVAISNNGMKDFFRDDFRSKNTKKLGGLDLYNKQYVLYSDDTEIPIGSGGNGVDPNEGTTPTPGYIPFNCGSTVEVTGVTNSTPLKVKALQVNGLGDIFVNYNLETVSDIVIDNNGDIINFPSQGPGLGSVSFTQTYDDVDFILIDVTPIATPGEFEVKIGSPCLVPDTPAPDPVVATKDDYTVYKGTVDNVLNVLYNDIYTLPVTITITSAPTEGTAVVSGNNILYTHTNVVDGDSDSLTYQIDDGLTTDTAIVTITALTDPGGGGNPSEGTAFQMSTSTALNPAEPDNGQVACSITSLNTYYHDGAFFSPGIGDKVYIDLYMSQPVVGGNEYRAIEFGRTIRIDNTGTVTDVFICE